MASVLAILLSLLVVLVLALVARHFRRSDHVPPGPKGWPIIGNAFTMTGENLYATLTEYSRTYGGIFSLQLGPKLVIILNTLDVAKEAYVDQASAFSKRFMPPAIRYIVGQEGSLIFGDGPIWKEQRKFLLSAFREFGVGKKSLQERVNEEASYVLEVIERAKGQPINIHFVINNAVSNIICSLSFGERFDYNDENFQNLLKKLHVNVSSISLGGIVHVFPFLMETPIYGYLKKNFQSLVDFVRRLSKEHSETFNGNDIRDILDKYLLEIQKQEDSGEESHFKRSDDWRLVFELFLAGTDTTTNTLLFTILFATYYPDIQQKISDEIDEVVGGARRPQLSDRPNMPYTEATILEVLRMRPAAPLGVPRSVSADTKVGGYFIPKGTGVFLNAFAINHDPQVWDRPYEFDPTRFLSPDGKKLIKNDSLMTFGTGRRACVGENLAKMELFFFVTNIFQRFHLRFPEGTSKPDLRGTQGISLKPSPFEICAERR
ncbi:cytochrome P450 2U1-like isoform X2 [Apostichopus japonicus]